MSWNNLIAQQSDLTYPDTTLENASLLIPLPNTSVIQVSGEEASVFLQNLLTNDVKALSVGFAQLSGFCNPKGRLLALFQLVRREQDYLMLLPADLAGTIAQRLTMFKLRTKVDIRLADELHVVGLFHPEAESALASVLKSSPLVKHAVSSSRSFLILDESESDLLEGCLANGWQLGSEAYWQLLDIEAGVPMVFVESKEAFTPQQLNLELLGGVSFKKGCYPGQEVVARLHYLGAPSRRMFLAEVLSSELPAVNTAVTDMGGETLGHVVQAQFKAEGKLLCLLSMKLSAIGSTAILSGCEVNSLTPLAVETAES